MQLTDEQKDVIKSILKSLNNEQVITLGGYAGVGKSTVIRIIMDVLKRKGLNFAAAAYTGKAANVLRKKGIEANTIHSTIYSPTKDAKGDTYWFRCSNYDLSGKGIEGFIIDEASMVSKEIHDDLISFGLPIIYVGDHGQLEPIGTKFNLMQEPMFKLETVHRNAGEIAYFAQHLRSGLSAKVFVGQNQVQIVNKKAIEDRHLASVDQIICAFNKTRVDINEKVRVQKGIQHTYIAKGEKIISLRNNKAAKLFNGMQGIVTKVYKSEKISFMSDGEIFEKIKYDPDQFGKEKNEFEFSQDTNPFDYAYAITAHKSQGDEFGSVIAIEQFCNKWDHKRWAYTVASRAKKSLIWVV
jgi:ATP-dependent exoDNAse (exonuclease V) alpha subunit